MPASLLTTTISDGSDVCRPHTPALRESMFLLEGYRAFLASRYVLRHRPHKYPSSLSRQYTPAPSFLSLHASPLLFSHVSFVRSHPISLLGFHHVPFGASFARY